MSGIQQLSRCNMGLHESWAPFPVKNYKRIIVFVAFLTPRNELLVSFDQDGKPVLPHEEFIVRNVLRGAPERVISSFLGFQPSQLFDDRSSRSVKLLGQCEIEDDFCVVMSAPISRPTPRKGWSYISGFEQLQQYIAQNPLLPAVAEKLGWRQTQMAA